MRALLLAATLLAPCLARAQPELSLRLGYAPSFGSAAYGQPMSEVAGAVVPLQADALWSFRRPEAEGGGGFAAGAYASYGLGFAAACDAEARCGASSFRLGLEGTWTFRPASVSFDAWVGAGAGYEWTTRRRTRGGETEWAYRGPELSLQGGADLLRLGRVSIGPFLLLALGRYSSFALETPVESAAGDLENRRVHAWLEIGVGARLDL